jgi:hypothetical protein
VPRAVASDQIDAVRAALASRPGAPGGRAGLYRRRRYGKTELASEPLDEDELSLLRETPGERVVFGRVEKFCAFSNAPSLSFKSNPTADMPVPVRSAAIV